MAKGQRRSNREAKKPKQPKSEKKSATSLPIGVLDRSTIQGQRHPPRR
jgi:hypothetical protein